MIKISDLKAYADQGQTKDKLTNHFNIEAQAEKTIDRYLRMHGNLIHCWQSYNFAHNNGILDHDHDNDWSTKALISTAKAFRDDLDAKMSAQGYEDYRTFRRDLIDAVGSIGALVKKGECSLPDQSVKQVITQAQIILRLGDCLAGVDKPQMDHAPTLYAALRPLFAKKQTPSMNPK